MEVPPAESRLESSPGLPRVLGGLSSSPDKVESVEIGSLLVSNPTELGKLSPVSDEAEAIEPGTVLSPAPGNDVSEAVGLPLISSGAAKFEEDGSLLLSPDPDTVLSLVLSPPEEGMPLLFSKESALEDTSGVLGPIKVSI